MTQVPKNTAGLFLKRFNWLFLIILIFTLAGFVYWSFLPVSSNNQPQTFVVKKGESVTLVAKRLQSEKLIRNQYLFRGLVIFKKLTVSIQAGSFKLSPSQTPLEIAQSLTHGTSDVWLTFPEGWRREEIANRLAANLENFEIQEFLNLTKNLEGQLFPDTYLLPKQATAGAVVRVMQNNFKKKVKTDENTLILASLIEREAKHDVDRPIITGILLKRLANNWPLQVDATVQYAVGNEKDWWPVLNKSDLQFKSPYNTYKNRGLPPTPICNPGLASIQAAENPQTSDYWFYLSDPTGVTHYAVTAADHAANVQKYLK